MKASVMDYGVGNLHSISKGLERAGASVEIVSDPGKLLEAQCIVFPGVGAFGAAMKVLRPALPGVRNRIAEGTPTLGVCLGMQILFERSEESAGEGVGVVQGEVKRFSSGRVPQMGWNDVAMNQDALFDGVPRSAQFYFANSYVCRPSESITVGETEYGERFPSAIRKGAICGVQFHPEKSGGPGLKVLENFVRLAEDVT
jgi:glutamine amidotransferase